MGETLCMAGRIFLKIRPAMHGFWCHLEDIWCHGADLMISWPWLQKSTKPVPEPPLTIPRTRRILGFQACALDSEKA